MCLSESAIQCDCIYAVAPYYDAERYNTIKFKTQCDVIQLNIKYNKNVTIQCSAMQFKII